MVYGSVPKIETIKLQVLGVELTSSIMLVDTQWINEVLHLRLSDLRWEIIRRSCSLGQFPEPFQVASLAIEHNKNNHLFVGNNIIKPSKELGPNSVHSLCSGNTLMVLTETINPRCICSSQIAPACGITNLLNVSGSLQILTAVSLLGNGPFFVVVGTISTLITSAEICNSPQYSPPVSMSNETCMTSFRSNWK